VATAIEQPIDFVMEQRMLRTIRRLSESPSRRVARASDARDPSEPVGCSYLDALVADSKVPGIQYLVVDSSGVLFEYAVGWADIAAARPMTSATTLMVYSMSKTITAAAVLRLTEEGELGLDDPVSRYVDALPYESNLTVRQLLTHTAGVPTPIPLRWAHLAPEHDAFDETGALAAQLRKNDRLSSAPGEKYAYSNLGYWLLGPLVERASGQAFSTYVTDHVLRPLGASTSELGYTVPDPTLHATGYLEKYSFLNLVKRFVIDRELIGRYQGRWLQINPHYVNGPAFGGLVGTSRGFGKFLQDQLRSESVLFGEETLARFYRSERTLDGAEVPMTPGWHVDDSEGVRHFYKEGGGGGFHSMMRIYRDHGIGSVVLTNATTFDVRSSLNVLDRQFLE
jgi:CubicO group peptidase (beta-lactamase class C family)